MKNILTAILLLLSLSLFSQTPEFHKTYTYFTSKNADGQITNNWQELTSTFIFNYKEDNSRVKMYVGDKTAEFIQVGNTVTSKTKDGLKFDLLILRDRFSEDVVSLQFFYDQKYGVRLIFDNLSQAQFSN